MEWVGVVMEEEMVDFEEIERGEEMDVWW